MSLRRTNRRLRTASAFVVFTLLLITGKAAYIQVVQGAEYRAAADDQYLRQRMLPAKRGVIYDRDGEELAVSRRTANIVASPKLVEDARAAAEALSPVLGMPVEDILPRLDPSRGFAYLARKEELSVAEAVVDLKIKGIGVEPEDKRVYPKGQLAPQLLGYVGTENKGLAGLEYEYDSVLAGTDDKRSYIGDEKGRALEILPGGKGREGSSITLTIDDDIQWQAEQVLTGVLKQFGAKKATAVVLDPSTGEVLALATAPTFDTNLFGEATPDQRRNMAVVDQYEPGSTFKVVTVAAALEEGLVTPETTFELRRSIKVWDKEVRESHWEELPEVRELSVTEILAKSSNVGTITLGRKVGKVKLLDMMQRFGFTDGTGIDFPLEATGDVPAVDEWSGTTIANVPIGQGVSVTPLQVAMAYATIANDGVYVQPFLVENEHVQTPAHRVLSSEVASQLREMLVNTVSEEGTGGAARVTGYEVAGKTGTAEKPKVKGRGYDTDRVVASFVGIVPADAPRLVILVSVDEPNTQHLGGDVAAPAFSQIAEFALKHLKIPPSEAGD